MALPIIPILIAAAARAGAPLVKELLRDAIGGRAADVAGAVIDTVAAQAGVPPSALPDLPPERLDAAVAAVERDPGMVALWAREAEARAALLAAEQREGWLAWGWRPAWMWLLAVMWTVRLLVAPVADALWGLGLAAGMDAGVMMTLTGSYLALYMGGHTLKDVAGKALETLGSRK